MNPASANPLTRATVAAHGWPRAALALSLAGVLAWCLGLVPVDLPAAETPHLRDEDVIRRGQELFTVNCAGCHEFRRRQIGPALGGVTKFRSREWLLEFVRGPLAMAARGDPQAMALLEHNRVPMPSFAYLPESDLAAIFAHIDKVSADRRLVFDPKANNAELQRLFVTPFEPIRKMEWSLVLAEYATVPAGGQRRFGPRLANMRFAPGDPSAAVFVNDQNGYIHRIESGRVEQVLDIGKKFPAFISSPGLATGLGSFAFHPDFADNGLAYVTHTEAFSGQPADFEYGKDRTVELQWVVSEVKLSGLGYSFDRAEWRELLRVNMPRSVHGIQDIGFAPHARKGEAEFGLLYLGIGDGGSTTSGYLDLCHSLASPLGTILRIDPRGTNGRNGRYGVPADNPFAATGTPAAWPEIYAYGFRNPHRLAWDHLNGGRLLAADVGENSFEEINHVEPGKDYGWNVREGNIRFDPVNRTEVEALPWDGPDAPYEKPFAAYSHREGAAVCGGHVYRGSVAALQGKYLLGDIVSGRVFFVDVTREVPGPQPLYELDVAMEGGEPGSLMQWSGNRRVDLRFGEDAAGELYLLSKSDGKIRRITGVMAGRQPDRIRAQPEEAPTAGASGPP